jgi:hypothetical protein
MLCVPHRVMERCVKGSGRRKSLVPLNEIGGPEGEGSRVGLRLLLPLGDAGARAVGREHQPVGLGSADGLRRLHGRLVQNGPGESHPDTLREHKLPTSRSGIVRGGS